MPDIPVRIIEYPYGEEPINPKYDNQGIKIPPFKWEDSGLSVVEKPTAEPDQPVQWVTPFVSNGEVGFIESLRLSEDGFAPPTAPGVDRQAANALLEAQTYCLLVLSSEPLESVDLKEYRIRYTNLVGEKLATSMAVVAALKDAFIHRSKIRVFSDKAKVKISLMGRAFIESDEFNDIRAVELTRS